MKYTCKRCGNEFEAKHKTAVCSNCRTAVCVVCGKEFKLQWPWTQLTCSSKCRGEYVKQSGIAKKRTQKARETLEDTYGVDNPQKLQLFTKTCKYCGRKFTTTSARREYCENDHYGPCPVCGKLVKITNMYEGPTACSEKCRMERISLTNLARYGSKFSITSAHAKAVGKQTCLQKYGVTHYSKTAEYKEKFTKTMLTRYGVEYALQSPEIKAKAKETNIKTYGGPSPMCNSKIKQKSEYTVTANYGGFGWASEMLSERIRATNIEKYGTPYPTQSEQIKQKTRETCLHRYGAEAYGSSITALRERITDPAKLDNFVQFRTDPATFILNTYDTKPTVTQICRDTGVTDTPVYNILLKNNCRELATFNSSTMELDIISYLQHNYPNIQINRNDRIQIAPQELDIYLPEYHIGIECNPTVTHNSSLPDPWGGEPKHYKYHQDKSLKAKDAGVFLFHIFGYEWTHRRDIILSMLSNLLGGTSSKVYARNTEVVQLSDNECKEFLNANHRQGGLTAKIRLGLKEKRTGDLVSVMTFNKMRSTIGETKNTESRSTYELSRFCSKLYTSVIGGASKLFKYFCNNYDVEKIVSFSDLAHTRGELYRILGFKSVSLSDPGYVWVNGVDDSSLHRVNCQKNNLPKLFHDDTIDIKNKTEKEIMEEHGYVRVYDSGVIRWEWKRI